MINICKKVNFSFAFILMMFLSLISGLFRDILILFLIIVVHEMGHIITSIIFKWKISRIDFTICGGYITYDEEIDKSFIQEFLIAISGIIFQTIFYLVVKSFNLVDIDTLFLIKKYHFSILLFNLLLIPPLDGSKIILILLNLFIPYKLSLKISSIISTINIFLIVICFVLFDFKIEYSYIMMITFLIFKLIEMIKDAPYLFNRFLFERYKNPIRKRKYVYVNNSNLSNLRRQKKHYFKIDNRYYDEKYVLSKRFLNH